MFYKICPVCGARLDPGERCDCEREGRTDVSPMEAAPILGSKNPYALNIGAKKHPQPGMYWHGRNLRISVRYLLNTLEARV